MLKPYFQPLAVAQGRRLWLVVGACLLTVLLALPLGWPLFSLPRPHSLSSVSLPLRFIPNTGQSDSAVRFQAHSAAGSLFFTADGVVLPITMDEARPPTVIRLHFEDANPQQTINGADRQTGEVNYLLGNDPSHWRTHLPTYAAVTYQDLYPGIALRYDGASQANGHLLKGTFTVAPGADPAQIRWRYTGATGVRLDPVSGHLYISLPPSAARQLIEYAPAAWQTIDGQRIVVPVTYALNAEGEISFNLPQGYDPTRPLVIDPVLGYSTYLGGSNSEYGQDIVVDDAGNAYITGYTFSSDFPTMNPVQPDFGGGSIDAFVVKLNPSGSDLVYATYLGGNSRDFGRAIDIDAQGAVYIAGETESIDFPTEKAIREASPGQQVEAFVAKLDPTGSSLVYSTFLGGKNNDIAYDLAVDNAGTAHVTGYTQSTDFPVIKAVQANPAFGQDQEPPSDIFVTTVISQSGVYTWGFSTFVGGTASDIGYGLTLNEAGDIYITGRTGSTDFPLEQPVQATLGGGGGDAFITKIITASGVYTWGYSTYLGGSGFETGNDIALNSSGEAYITGHTGSSDFPTQNPIQFVYGGNQDAFITKIITASGVYTWGYSTYLGGDEDDRGHDIAVDATEAIYVGGYSRSQLDVTGDAYDFTCGTDDNCASSGDAFWAKLSPDGDTLLYATYLGGNQTDVSDGLALDAEGNVYLTGNTASPDFPTTSAAYNPDCNLDGSCSVVATDAFVAKFILNPNVTVAKTADPTSGTPVQAGDQITYTLVVSTANTITGVTLSDPLPDNTGYISGTVSSTMGTPTFDGSQISLMLPSLAENTRLTVTFQVQVVTTPTTSIVNKATLQSDQLDLQDSNPVSHPPRIEGDYFIYLPIIFKNFPEPGVSPTPTPLPPGCVPDNIATITVGNTPQGIAIDAGRQRVYVANQGSNSVSVIDSSSNTVIQTISGIAAPRGVAVDTARNIIWVTSLGNNTVVPIQANAGATSFSLLAAVNVGQQPWDVAYNPISDAVYVTNNQSNSVSVIDAGTRTVSATLSGSFDQPFHLAVNPTTGKVYVANFGNNSVTVLSGASVFNVVSLFDSNQPYGIDVDEVRNLIYVSTVSSHRIVAIDGVEDKFLGWAAFNRGFNDPNRPVPLRALALNPDIGPAGDGGHLWSLTATADGSEFDQVLLIPKGWASYFNSPLPYNLNLAKTADLAVNRTTDRVYVANGLSNGTVTVLGDSSDICLVPFDEDQMINVTVSVK